MENEKISPETLEFMRQDLASGMALSRFQVAAEKFLRERMAKEGKDFDAEFEKWKKSKEVKG